MPGTAPGDAWARGDCWFRNRGCAVGCTLVNFDAKAAFDGDHARYETLFGINRDVPLLEDTLFELLPPAESQAWPERFVRALASGADVSDVVTRWIIWLLNDEASPVYEHVARGVYERRLTGAVPRLHGVRSGTAGAEHERTQRVERAPREHHAADGRRTDRAAREGAHPGAGSIWLAGRSRRPGATTRRARGETPENAQITVQAGTPQGSRTAGVPLLPMEHQAGVVRGAELVDEDGQTSRDGLADDPRARHVELGDELALRQTHLGGSIKRLGSAVRRRARKRPGNITATTRRTTA